jgi:hypothetical protein
MYRASNHAISSIDLITLTASSQSTSSARYTPRVAVIIAIAIAMDMHGLDMTRIHWKRLAFLVRMLDPFRRDDQLQIDSGSETRIWIST